MTRSFLLTLPLLALATPAFAGGPPATVTCRAYEWAEDYVDAFNSKDANQVAALYDPSFVVTSPYGVFDTAGWVGLTGGAWYAFPDIEWTVVQVVPRGNLITVEYSFEGTFENDFLGYTAVGQHIVGRGLEINELDPKTCKIVETWNYSDAFGFLAQLQ